ncbi:Zn-dependent protease with chaperone function [Halopiger aswanensis]|uniref:Zn-dependent protease with chaperone function n=2 Tax=Halopiger aswanensis TaxID=148449 RepID=A0A419WIT3_9EURY|nr:Zn-dependent protease with chaperone function [Halopiger aswanensis]
MAVAVLLVGSAQFAVLALEFVVGGFVALFVLVALEDFFALLFVCSLVLAVAFVCWLVLATVIRRCYPERTLSDRLAHDGVADAVESVGETLLSAVAIANWPKILALFVGVALGTFVGFAFTEAVAWRSIVDPLSAAAAVGVLVVIAHVVWIAYSERVRDTAPLRDVEDAARVLERPDGDLEERRAAVRRRVERLARQADLPAPTVRLGVSPTPTAATVGYRPESSTIVVSEGLLEAVDDRELDAVLAHELAHVKNRDAAVLTALSVPAASAAALIERYNGNPYIALPCGLVIVIVRWSVAVVTRYREYVADRSAVAITGDLAALAGALETLDAELERRPSNDLREHRSTAAFSIVPPPWEEHRFFDRTRRFVSRTLFGTHPSTEKRIERLRARA